MTCFPLGNCVASLFFTFGLLTFFVAVSLMVASAAIMIWRAVSKARQP